MTRPDLTALPQRRLMVLRDSAAERLEHYLGLPANNIFIAGQRAGYRLLRDSAEAELTRRTQQEK